MKNGFLVKCGLNVYLFIVCSCTLKKQIQAMMLRGGDADIMKMGKDKDMLRWVNKTQGLCTWREEDPK